MAIRQTAGRGRLGRSFASSAGGLWISAVLPTEGAASRWNGFSLTTGWHLLRLLRDWGVSGARLRWPNDLMIDTKKVGGILIEQGVGGAMIVGFGLNLTNQPWKHDATLEPIATRLADHLNATPEIWDAATQVLNAIAEAHHTMESHGLDYTIEQLNVEWRSGRNIRIQSFDGNCIAGRFTGLDSAGNLRLTSPDGQQLRVEHQHVERLIEI